MTTDDLLHRYREDILRLAQKHGARNVRLFGSVARGDAGPESDMDFLVDMEPGRTLFDLIHLQMDLEELLGRPVDLAEPDGVYWYIREQVLAEAQPL